MAQHFGPINVNSVANLEQAFESELIRSVQKFQFLYDNKHPDFSNLTRNRMAWSRIALLCRKSFSECENKWHSLLQTYFSSPSSNWIHLAELKKCEPYLSHTFGRNYNPANPHIPQKEELLKALLYHSSKLLLPDLSPHERQIIWTKISNQCNTIKPGASMSTLKWQRYWYSLKQECGTQWFKLRPKLKAMGTKLDVSRYTDDEINILKICGASPMHNLADICKALGNNIELGTNTELIIPKCKRCLLQRNELIIDGHCETCRNTQSCPLCRFVIEDEEVKYKLKDWSKEALSLLPSEYASRPEISVCTNCSKALNKKATLEWKTCRICEADQPNLEFLYSSNNQHLRRVFNDATNFVFSEYDGLPGYICKVCKIQIQQLNNFYTKFWRTQCRLRTIHSINFIGNQAIQSLKKDAKVVYVNKKNSNVMILPRDTAIQSNQVNNSLTPSLAGTSSSMHQQNCQTKNNIAGVTSFKRVCIRKPMVGSANTIGEGTTGKAVAAPKPTLAIKDIYSLQPINSQSNSMQPSLSVISSAALQSSKVDEVFSNKNVTITRKVYDSPQTLPTKQNTNGTSLNQGSNAALQLGTGQSVPNTSVTITKRVIATPQSAGLNQKPIEAKEISTLVQRSAPPNSSKPAIFTISDYETIEDAPPVFCIPKNAENTTTNDKIQTDADKQLIGYNPNPPVAVKTEITDENPGEKTITQSDPISNADSMQKIAAPPNLPNLPNQKEPTSKSDVKIIRLNGNMVAVKPHPYIAGAFMPIDSEKSFQVSSTGANRFIPSIIRKVNSGSKTQVTPVRVINKIPDINQTKIVKVSEPKLPTLPVLGPRQIQPKPQATTAMSSEQGEMFLQQQQQQATKKARKYWGTVDEFQVAPLPTKITAMPPMPQLPPMQQLPPMPQLQTLPTLPTLATAQKTNELQSMNASAPWIDRRSPAQPHSADPLNIVPSSKVHIKTEIPESAESIPTMFYPDSFELENVSLGVDVSLMIKDLMTQQSSIACNMGNNMGSNMGNNTFNNYLNPLIPIPYGEKEKQSQDEEKVKRKREEAMAELRKKAREEERMKEIKTETEEIEEIESIESTENMEEKTSSKSIVKLPPTVKLRKLRIKLKRHTLARHSLSRPKRSCTLQTHSLRKSTRLTQP